MKLPAFIELTDGMSPEALKERYGPGFILINVADSDDEDPSDRFVTVQASSGENPMAKELNETEVIPLVKRDPNAPGFMITVGRANRSDVFLDHNAVSKFHGYFRYNEAADEYTLTDGGSANGTYVNNRKLEANKGVTLKGGDSIMFGTAYGGTFHSAESMHRYIGFYRRLL